MKMRMRGKEFLPNLFLTGISIGLPVNTIEPSLPYVPSFAFYLQ
jgi:hypothetical protein